MPLKGKSFGQERPPLTDVIKNILLRYPDGGQILKELIQNADDAGASEVRFLYDDTAYGTISLVSPSLAVFQGPALYCYNSAQFTDEDWQGIQHLMRSNKKDKPLKVGRFGIGFNSVYHITDLPSIVSGDRVAFLDPHEKYFKRGEPGQSYSIDDLCGENLAENNDQFSPFHDIFGCSLEQGSYFKGTLFRFPLRVTPSELSKKIYTKQMVLMLFESFETESSIILHFLKSIESISLYTRENRGAISQKYCVRLSDICKADVRARRCELTAGITTEWDYAPVSVFYTLKVEELCGGKLSQTRDWYMACQVGTTEERLISLAKELQLLPWIGVAYPVDVGQASFHKGRIFCFLPLPPDADCRTGLPVQVNGYFGLTDNRRSLKWPGPDCQNDDTATWNELLLRTLGSQVYISLIENMVQLFSPKSGESSDEIVAYANLVYSAIPRACDVKEDWKCILEWLFIELLRKKIFYTAAIRGKAGWLSLDRIVLDRLNPSDERVNHVVRSTLLMLGQPVVTVPVHVLELIDGYFGKSGLTRLQQITPCLLRGVLRYNSDWLSMATQEKLLLLTYILQDSQFHDLAGIALLPLQNDTFDVFKPSSSCDTSKKVYITSHEHQAHLLPNAHHRLLNESLPPDLKHTFVQLTSQQHNNNAAPTQLFQLTKQDVLELLWQTFPEEWSKNKTPWRQVVSWSPEERYHPPEFWLEGMWQWIREQFPHDLHMLENVPLIPVSSHSSVLARLSHQSKMVFASGATEVLTLPLRQLLVACGCIIVDDPPSYLRHDHLQHYISPPTAQGVLDLLMTSGLMNVLQQLQHSSPETKCQLRSYFATLTTLTPQHILFIRALPIFTSLGQNHFLSCCANNPDDRTPVAPPNFCLPPWTRVVDPSNIISSMDEESFALLKKLCMSIETTASLLMRHLDAYLSNSVNGDQEKDTLMLWVLQYLEILGAEDHSFTPYLSQLAFVPTASGSRLAPCQLLDHTDQLLRDLYLDNPSAFAVDSFHDALETRKSSLGIRCKNDLNANDLVEVMTSVKSTSPHNSFKRGLALLDVLNQRPALLTHALSHGSLLRDRLSQLAWLPRVVIPPDNYPSMMPWYNDGTLCKPIEMYPGSMAFLVGASQPLFDERHVEVLVQEAFCFPTKHVIVEVVEQLRLAIQTWNEQESKPTGMELAKFVELLKRVYQEFSKNGRDVVQQLLTKAGISDWLWHGNGFTSPQKLAFNRSFPSNILLNPHLYLVPTDFYNLQNFLLSFAVKNEFQDEDLFMLLWSIKGYHDNTADVSNAQVTQDLDCCRIILEWLVRDGRTLSDTCRRKLYIPVQSCSGRLRLELCNECTYCDREFLRHGGSEYNVTENFHLIHKYIPDGLAGSLGVPRLSRCLSGAEAMGIIEEAGQHEPLTTRLRNILDEYKEGVAIFKELIQNADDAGAREVCFVVDWRETRGERLLGPNMAKCQGPALWAHNDAQFSSRDFENINLLAGGTKKADLDKIGRFGLGFNAVYHLTDVPSFISGEYFVTFDPNMTHIHDIVGKNARPGLKINLVNSHNVFSLFPDQFSPYNGLFGCNTKDSSARSSFPYAGTLFRFPLRTRQQANESEISKRSCSREDICHMLQSLKASAETLLLFAQNVKLVKVFEIANNGDPIDGLNQPLLTITKHVQVFGSECVDKGKTFLHNVSNWWKNRVTNTHAQEENVMNLRQMELVTISVSVSESKLTNSERCEEHTDTWLVNSCSGRTKSVVMASSLQGRRSGLLPISGVAAKMQNIHQECFEFISVSGEVFCFLPLSFTSGLSVHVNANFAVLSNRRGLWEEGVGDHETLQPFEAKWNGALMSDALVRAYLQLLEVVKRDTASTQYVFHSLWPDPSHVTYPVAWKPFIDAFFETIIREQLSLFFCNEAWRALQDCLILDEKLNIVNHCVPIMTSLGLNVLTLPPCFADAFRACGQADVIAQQTLTEDKFLRLYFFPNVASLPSDMRDSVLCYVLQLRLNDHHEYDELFHSHPCFNCSKDDSILRTPRELVHPRGKVADLFSPDEGRFPVEEKFLTAEHAMMLEQLGMVVHHLTWQRICERAECIAGRERIRAMFLIKYMAECLDGPAAPSEQDIERLKASQILPFLAKPKDYPISWEGQRILEPESLFSANDLYPSNLKNLVGCSKLVFNESAISGDLGKLKRVLGLTSKKPHLKDVLTQLDNIIHHVNSSSSRAQDAVTSICDAIYKHFENLSSLKKQKDDLVYQLSKRPWILIEDNMVESSLVAMTALPLDCSPYLRSLPKHYNYKYPTLIKLCRVKERFTVEDIEAAVGRVRADTADRALSERQLRILQTFLEEITKDWNPGRRDVSLPLPDSDRVIWDGGRLVMNDAPWLKPDNTIHYVYHTIPRKLGYQCGATPLVDALVVGASIPMGQPFGQHECLTDRLKGILKSYPADEGILKELVQNADDAKASEIHFVFDPRNHGNDRVFSKHWGELCGPAICVYNDRTFSREDIQGIQNLGMGSKMDDPVKTGQYGIGFNAVYHFTDCPSFLSDDAVLCVSDPHLRYVPGASNEKPGRLFNQLDARFRANFQDVFTGFLGELFQLKGATMFRFPLRSFGSAFRSNVSSEIFSSIKVREILKMFRQAAKEMLLFLNNIKKISISEIQDGRLQTYSVLCSVSDEETRRNFAQKIISFKTTPTAEISWHIICYVMTISDTEKTKNTWLVCQALGSKKISDQHATVVPDGLKWGLLPRAGIAASFGDRYSHRLSHRAFCFLPLPMTTQLPVHVNGHFALDSARRDLWYDPSPGDERTRWNEFVKRHVIAPAYAYLIEEARNHIPGIEGIGLRSFPSERSAQDGLRSYHKLFPYLRTADRWKTVAEAVYLFLANESKRVLPVVQSVPKKVEFQAMLREITATLNSPPSKPVPVSWKCVADSIFSQTKEDLAQTLLDLGMSLLSHTPSEVYDGFASCKSATQVSPTVVTDFLRTQSDLRYRLPAPVKQTVLVNHAIVASLLEYCLQEKDYFFEHLQGVPLLLTHDGILRNFGQHPPVFSSDFALLLPGIPEQFLHKYLKILLHAHLNRSSGLITEFNLSELSKFKTSIFPEAWGEFEVHHPWSKDGDGELGPTAEWIKNLWLFIDEMTSSTKVKERLDCILDDLRTWPIIPSVQGYLVPVSLSKTVLNQSSLISPDDPTSEERRTLVTNIGCAQLDSSLMPRTRSNPTGGMLVRQQYLANIQSPKDVLGILSYTLGQPSDADKRENFSNEEIMKLLLFFQTNANYLEGDVLRKLPFFLTVNGNYISLANDHMVFELPDHVPPNDCESLSRTVPCVILLNTPELRRLYKHIGIQKITALRFYVSIVFKHFNSLSHKGRLCHLMFIRDRLICGLFRKNERTHILNVLSELPFIPTANGVLHQACKFYDDANKVFKAFEPKESFPPEPFNEKKWGSFLRQIGLTKQVSQVKFEEYAKLIEREALNQPSPIAGKISEMSHVLVSCLFNDKSLHGLKFLQRISKIKFVPAARLNSSLLAIHPSVHGTSPANARIDYIQFSDSVISKYQNLVWSTATILSPQATPNLETQLINSLNICTTPPHSAVLLHIKNVAFRFYNMVTDQQVPDTMRRTLSWLMRKLYQHLGECCPRVQNMLCACSAECQKVQTVLRNVPFILIDESILVRCDQLAFNRAYKALEPYLFKVPRDLTQYEHFLKKLGAQETATPLQYSRVLQALQESCKDKEMHPGEQHTAITATRGLFNSLHDDNTFDASKSLEHTAVLYLPTADYHLKASAELLVNDSMEPKERVTQYLSRLVFDFSEANKQRAEKLVQLLPARLQLRNLSSEVEQTLSPDCIDQLCVLDQCEFIAKYRQLLCSREFSDGLVRLFKYQKNKPEVSKDDEGELKSMESRLSLTCMQSITTTLVSVITGETMEGSEMEESCVLQNVDKEFKLFLKHGQESSSVLHLMMASFVHRVTGCLIERGTWPLVMIMLEAEHPREISAKLDAARVPRDVTASYTEPAPGEKIPEHFHVLLNSDMEYRFCEGELVAYELQEEDAEHDVVYVFVKIVEKKQIDEGVFEFTSRYKIDIGQDELVDVSRCKLYKFDRKGTKVANPRSEDIVPYESDGGTQATNEEPVRTRNVEEAKREIAECLKEIWKLSESERNSAVRRLIRVWHPDKNDEELATEATKFLFNEVERLKKGGTPGHIEPGCETQDGGSSSSNPGPEFDFQRYWRECGRQRERDRRRYDEWRDNANNESRETEYEPVSEHEARIWIRQARVDLDAAKYFYESNNATFHCLTCFHCQQMAEKSLKALLFAKGKLMKQDLQTHETMTLAYRVATLDARLHEVPELVMRLHDYYINTRYPQYQRSCQDVTIPAEKYTALDAQLAINTATNIFKLIKDVLGV